MDVSKLFKKLMNREEVRGIPLIHIFTVLNCVLDIIGSGDCFYPREDEQ